MIEPDENLNKILIVDIDGSKIGLLLIALEKNYMFNRVVDYNDIDITKYTHNKISKTDCFLFHTKTYFDWMEHVFQDHTCFEEADFILLKSQLTNKTIEQLIFGKFRTKTILISQKNIDKYILTTNTSQNIKDFYLEQYKETYQIRNIYILLYWMNKKCQKLTFLD